MTNDNPAKSDLLIQVVAGVVVLILGGAGTWLLGVMSAAKVPVWWYLVGIVVVGLFATLIFPPWRRGVWGNVAKWRPLTTKSALERSHAAGRAEVEDEIAAIRARPLIRAQWLVGKLPNPKGPEDKYKWQVMNVALDSVATGVSVHPGIFFKAGSALDWPSVNGGEIVNFVGNPTPEGNQWGVEFVVSWTDANSEYQTAQAPWRASGY